MPLPKGINRPDVPAESLSDRRGKLLEFDRLVGEGLSKPKAARRLGVTHSGVRAMRRSVELMERDQPHRFGRNSAGGIDLGLALLSCLRRPGGEPDMRGHRGVVRHVALGHPRHRAARVRSTRRAESNDPQPAASDHDHWLLLPSRARKTPGVLAGPETRRCTTIEAEYERFH